MTYCIQLRRVRQPCFALVSQITDSSMLRCSMNSLDKADALFCWLQVQRHESCEVVLHGRSEFEATDVVIKGSQRFEVPDGYKMTVTAGAAGFQTKVQALTADPSWEWKYSMADEGNIEVAMQEHPSMQQHRQVMHDAAALSYII